MSKNCEKIYIASIQQYYNYFNINVENVQRQHTNLKLLQISTLHLMPVFLYLLCNYLVKRHTAKLVNLWKLFSREWISRAKLCLRFLETSCWNFNYKEILLKVCINFVIKWNKLNKFRPRTFVNWINRNLFNIFVSYKGVERNTIRSC